MFSFRFDEPSAGRFIEPRAGRFAATGAGRFGFRACFAAVRCFGFDFDFGRFLFGIDAGYC
jgi:hypothetical protein